MSQPPDLNYPRTLYEARLDAECYAVGHELHARLWRRFRTFMRFVAGLSGTAAFGGWLATRPEVAGLAGLAIGVLTALDQAIDPSEKIARHRMTAQRYHELKRDAVAHPAMPLHEFDARLEAIKSEDEAGIDALMLRAFNRVVAASGQTAYGLPESRLCRFIAFFA